LVLADNRLHTVPDEIGRLKKPRMLDLGHNTRCPTRWVNSRTAIVWDVVCVAADRAGIEKTDGAWIFGASAADCGISAVAI
jgi:hypothetical protein